MKKTGVVSIVSFFPSDLVMVRWVHFFIILGWGYH